MSAVALLAVGVSPGCQLLEGKPDPNKGRGQDPVTVTVVSARLDRVARQLDLVGVVAPESEIQVVPKVGGRLIWIVAEWARVAAGQEIARVETPELAWQVRQARAAVETAKAGAALARANKTNAVDNLARSVRLFDQGAASKQQRDQSASAEAIATAQVDQARSGIAQAEAGLEVLEAQLRGARLVAPANGVVTRRMAAIGSLVGPMAPIMALAAGSKQVRIPIAERDLGFVVAGMPAEVGAAAFSDKVFRGTLQGTSPSLDPQTRAVTGKVVLVAADALKFGMSVRVRLQGAPHQALLVPVSALQAEGAKQMVYLVDKGKARKIAVEIGARLGDRIEVRGDLAPGSQVVSTGADFLADGDPIVLEKAQ